MKKTQKISLVNQTQIKSIARRDGWTVKRNTVSFNRELFGRHGEVSALKIPSLEANAAEPLTENISFTGDLKTLMLPITDQVDSAACASFATITMLRARCRLRGEKDLKFSPWHLHFCVLDLGYEDFANLNVLFFQSKSRGIPLSDTVQPARQDRAFCLTSPPSTYRKISGYSTFQRDDELRKELRQVGPVVAIIQIDAAFMTHYGSGYYSLTGIGQSSLHAVCIFDFDDLGWIGVNSRGPGWGENGFFRIRYGQCGLLRKPDCIAFAMTI